MTVAAHGPGPHFAAAALRHCQDAEYLRHAARLPAADHLAGFAAECAIKAILTGFLGATLSAKGIPQTTIGGKTTTHGHLPPLWNNISLVAQGRSGAQFAAIVARPNPFHAWDVADRYSDGAFISEARVTGHIIEAKSMIGIYQTAKVAGALQ